MTDEEIISELRKGNDNVLRHVYPVLDSVVQFIKSNSGSEQDAYDVFQDAVVIFYRKALDRSFVLSTSLSSYLFGICKNLWLKELRDNKREESFKSDYRNSLESDLLDDDAVEKAELERNLKTVISELGEKCMNILKLYYFQKFSLEEIKEKMGSASSQVVKQQKYRCLQKIREKLRTFQSIKQ